LDSGRVNELTTLNNGPGGFPDRVIMESQCTNMQFFVSPIHAFAMIISSK